MKQRQPTCGRQISIKGMAYAPTNELGVVCLFGMLARRLGFCIESVHPHFPDCWARKGGKLLRIEFEFSASNYKNHPAKGADYIVCWENDWETRPARFRHLKIISLKSYVDAERRVFVVGCNDDGHGDETLRRQFAEWNVPTNAELGDLVLIYRAQPSSAIKDLWEVVGPPKRYKKRNKEGYWPGVQAPLRNVARLNKPLTYASLAREKKTKNLTIVRKRFQGKMDITEDWHALHERIVALNPSVRKKLEKYVL